MSAPKLRDRARAATLDPARCWSAASDADRSSESGATFTPADLMTLDELAQRLKITPKTIKRLQTAGLPLFRVMRTGPLFACWPEVARWILQRKTLKL